MAGYAFPMLSLGDELISFKDELSKIEGDVRAKSANLTMLRRARDQIAACTDVRLHYVDLQPGIHAEFEAPSDLSLVWIDREIAAAKIDLRKALIALREYAVKQADAL